MGNKNKAAVENHAYNQFSIAIDRAVLFLDIYLTVSKLYIEKKKKIAF